MAVTQTVVIDTCETEMHTRTRAGKTYAPYRSGSFPA